MKSIARFMSRLPYYFRYGKWANMPNFNTGYTILLPMPMDMPFLLRIALEGLSFIDTAHCGQILIVPDGWGDDAGRGLKEVVNDFKDCRLEFVDLSWLDYRSVRLKSPTNFAHTHWMATVHGIQQARHEFVFLHDADAFFCEAHGLESHYQEILGRRLDVLGVTARWDPFFKQHNVTIAGTWELMFSNAWARKRSPVALMPGYWDTPYGQYAFDSMHKSQFLDRDSGNIGIMNRPTSFVHFNGTICTYRSYRDSGGKPVTDELFRLLLISVLETALGVSQQSAPSVAELVDGITNPNAKVRYNSELNQRGYAEFRKMMEQLVDSPPFSGKRRERILELLLPFDEYFRPDLSDVRPAISQSDERQTGLG